MSTAADAAAILEKINRRRQLTEALIHAGRFDNIGPAKLAETIHRPPMFVRRAHIDLINRELTRLLIDPDGALMIFTPPRVGKSTMVSRYFPFWWLGNIPTAPIMLGSYGLSLAMRHAAACRAMVETYGQLYGLSLSPTQATKSDWQIEHYGGGMMARGVGGGMTGQDMALGIIDDPVKDRAAAESETIRKSVVDWYSGSWTSRKVPGTREVLVMTRWRADDLAGVLLDRDGRVEEGGRWRVVHLPAIAMEPDPEKGVPPDPLGRDPGQPLTFPTIDPDDTKGLLAHWAKRRAGSSSRDWNALYQGVPFDAEGALLTEHQIRDHTATPPEPGSEHVVRAAVGVDPSGGGRDTAGIVGGVLDDGGRMWWVADRTARMSAEKWSREACLMAVEIRATRIVVEANYGGDATTTLIRQAWDHLVRDGEIPAGMLCPLIVPVHSRQSKVLRAEPIAQAVTTDRAWFAPGLQQFTDEWQLWTPGSKYSPGALDAGVHVAWDLLPPIARGSAVTTAAGRSRTEIAQGASLLKRRR
ncbi:terminase family protein [Williamsia herbipolensis]|uniref:Terminase family protein n=1 Tax=Williamsia herbipolensis TaxID=1603258 RepID=A0AAU4K012_9NOCA|nr:terminase family protein [Williamsia herbipolensis]